MNIKLKQRIQPVQSTVDTSYSDQINFVVQALVESSVPLPSTRVNFIYNRSICL